MTAALFDAACAMVREHAAAISAGDLAAGVRDTVFDALVDGLTGKLPDQSPALERRDVLAAGIADMQAEMDDLRELAVDVAESIAAAYCDGFRAGLAEDGTACADPADRFWGGTYWRLREALLARLHGNAPHHSSEFGDGGTER